MKKLYLFFLFAALGLSTMVSAQNQPSPQLTKVLNTLTLVNDQWQQTQSPQSSAFWNWAVYHTGNMELYRLLTHDIGSASQQYKQKAAQYLAYSTRWAEYNHWQGATEKDASKWRYRQYGEDAQHVLFGDWQICFQTYIDLYHIAPSKKKVARAIEVMNYEADSKAHDYWWWADALYMSMPVMTKMYKLTGKEKYLEKMYENLLYTDSLMFDASTGLYFRDARYVYPKHRTVAGKKDYWARGNGWVLAGLAKVLQDLPKTNAHYTFFVNKFQVLAKAVAGCQQPEGYWTRSMVDPSQAPGPETSGTALFTYGLLWGINNGLLSETDYLPTVSEAWSYLTTTALQPDGQIGYVQPIGDRAIPGQTVDGHSHADFGVGAFLLAGSEYYRWLDAALKGHRQVTVTIANSASRTRQQVVEVDAAALRKALGASADASLVVKNAAGQELDAQLTYDGKLLIDASVLPQSTWTVYVSVGQPKTMTHSVKGALYKIRKDDIAWENDRCAYRVYGPALQRTGEKSYGTDVWVKNTPDLILDRRYTEDHQSNVDAAPLEKSGRSIESTYYHANGSFHLDHGNGMDGYGVGPTLGCGAPALLVDGKWTLPYCYQNYEILDNGPLRFTVRLDYGKNPDGVDWHEHRILSLDKGSNFNKITVWYDNLSKTTTLCSGVTLNGQGTETAGKDYVAYADPTDQPKVHGSEIYVAVLFPYNDVRTGKSPDGRNAIVMLDNYHGQPVTYYAGAAWSRYDIANFDIWKLTVGQAADDYRQPLTVTVK